MPSWSLYAIGGGLLLGIAALLMWGALNAKYNEGREFEKNICITEKFDSYQKGVLSRKEIDIDVKKVTIDDIDRALAAIDQLRDEGK